MADRVFAVFVRGFKAVVVVMVVLIGFIGGSWARYNLRLRGHLFTLNRQ